MVAFGAQSVAIKCFGAGAVGNCDSGGLVETITTSRVEYPWEKGKTDGFRRCAIPGRIGPSGVR